MKDLLALSTNELRQDLAVEVQGLVTLCDAEFKLLFVHDGHASAYVHTPSLAGDFPPGQRLDVKGVARAGQFAPFISQPSFSLLGTEPLPPPLPASEADLLSGRLDAQWVETAGVVTSERLSRGRWRLGITAGPIRYAAYVRRHLTNSNPSLVDSRVSLRGVVLTSLNATRQVTGLRLFVNSMADVRVLEPSPGPPALAKPRLATELLAYQPDLRAGRRVRVQGLVAAVRSGDAFVLLDPSGAVDVHCASNTSVAPGEVVDVTGALADRPCAAELEEAVARQIGTTCLPLPTPLPVDTLLPATWQNRVVETEGRLLARAVVGSNCVQLALQSGPRVLLASLYTRDAPASLAALEPGSLLKLTGLCRLAVAGRGLAGTGSGCRWCGGLCTLETEKRLGDFDVELWLPSAADVRVLAGPRHPLAAVDFALLGLGGLLSLAGLGTIVTLGRKSRRELSHALQRQLALQTEIQEGEMQLRRSLEERQRLALDLHDDLIQSVYAVGLCLEDCRRTLRQAPAQAEARLGGAINSLNAVIRTARNFIAGLEPKVLDGRELRTALKSLALTLGEDRTQFAIEVDSQAAGRLNPTQATELLHIAKEAMSNSVRHAHAPRLAISLKQTSEGVCLEVADEGAGFDPQAAGLRGQGLRNMAARAQAVGGRLEVHSAPGRGCRVTVGIPQRIIHEPDL
jgi:signal transduction histidine kinase